VKKEVVSIYSHPSPYGIDVVVLRPDGTYVAFQFDPAGIDGLIANLKSALSSRNPQPTGENK